MVAGLPWIRKVSVAFEDAFGDQELWTVLRHLPALEDLHLISAFVTLDLAAAWVALRDQQHPAAIVKNRASPRRAAGRHHSAGRLCGHACF